MADTPVIMENSFHPPPSIPSSIIEQCFLAERGLSARPWQVDVVRHILDESLQDDANKGPHPILLVRSTGGGKSAVRDIAGIMCGGVVLTIVPLLSLSADQTAKVNKAISDLSLSHADCYNLDVERNPGFNEDLRRRLESLDPETDESIFLFSSPQNITQSAAWQKTIRIMLQKRTLSFIAVDECHLFASQGMEFRGEFYGLQEALFSSVTNHASSSVPILFMTATATKHKTIY